MANARFHQGSQEDFVALHDRIKRGDIVGFKGHPTRSKAGELSILPTEVIQLTPCLHTLPHTHYGVKDKELRFSLQCKTMKTLSILDSVVVIWILL